MAKVKSTVKATHTPVHKNTSQDGSKMASMNKSKKRTYKAYRGQGR